MLTEVSPEMLVHTAETFGPVATLYRVHDLAEAVELANATPYGLSSNIWTMDPEEREYCLRELVAGGLFFNGMTASHPALPSAGSRTPATDGSWRATASGSSATSTTVWLGNP
ncbi:hypothetical protein GCM10020229_25930 [Kitasatospora albolonga]